MDSQKLNKPSSSAFKQQNLKSYKFTISKKCLGLFYGIFGILSLLISAVLISQSNSVIEHKIRYDNRSECKLDWQHPKACTIEFEINDKMLQPIFIYYEITNFYQNHRRYIKSRDIQQLMGEDVTKVKAESRCYPAALVEEMGLFVNNPGLSPRSLASPCGLVARSYFNDSYSISPKDSSQKQVKISFRDISWDFDRKFKFKNHDSHLMWTDVEQGHFINWASPSCLSTARKLWGRIDDDLDTGKYLLTIYNKYDVSGFDSEKRVALTTSSAFGGKSVFLGVLCLVVGVLSCLFAIGIFLMILRRRKQKITFE